MPALAPAAATGPRPNSAYVEAVSLTEITRFDIAFDALVARGEFPTPTAILREMGLKATRNFATGLSSPVGGPTLNQRLASRRIARFEGGGFRRLASGRWTWPL